MDSGNINNPVGLGRPFYFLWCGETVSLIGTALMEFALGVWVYQQSGSVLDFSGVVVAAVVPALFVMPFAGSIVDRFDRRYVMVAADITTAILTLGLAWLLWRNTLEIKHLYGFNVLASLIGAFRMPAYNASVSALLPKEKLTRANGLMGISSNLLSMFAPLMAGGLMAAIGLPGIVSIDLFAFCLGSLLILRAFFYLDQEGRGAKHEESSSDNSSLLITSKYFRQEPAMLGLLFYVLLQDGLLTLVSTMIMPMILSRYSEEELGIVLTIGSIGGLLGSVFLATRSNFTRLMVGILAADVVLAISIMIAGVSTSFIVYCTCAFFALFASGFSEGCSHSLWMRKIPNQYQGRIFSMMGVLILSTTASVTLFGGIVAEKFFEPALMEGGALSMTMGSWIGTGKGRGLGLLFIICGFLGFVVTFSGFATKLRRLDLIVPDVALPSED